MLEPRAAHWAVPHKDQLLPSKPSPGEGSIQKKPEIPKHPFHDRNKSFLSLISHVPREMVLLAPALQIKEERLELVLPWLHTSLGSAALSQQNLGSMAWGIKGRKAQVSVGAQPGTFTAFGIGLKSCFAF